MKLPSRKVVVRWFIWMNALILAGCLVGWPLSQLTVARGEPPFILGLSWMALILSAWGNLLTATVKSDVTG